MNLHPPSPDLRHARSALLTWALDTPIGTIGTFDSLLPMTQITKPQLYQSIPIVNDILLLNHHRMLVNVRTVGYKIAEAIDHTSHGDHRRLKALRQHRWAMKELTHTDIDRMSREEQDRHQRVLAHVSLNLQVARLRSEQVKKRVEQSMASHQRGMKLAQEGLALQQRVIDDFDALEAQIQAIKSRFNKDKTE